MTFKNRDVVTIKDIEHKDGVVIKERLLKQLNFTESYISKKSQIIKHR